MVDEFSWFGGDHLKEGLAGPRQVELGVDPACAESPPRTRTRGEQITGPAQGKRVSKDRDSERRDMGTKLLAEPALDSTALSKAISPVGCRTGLHWKSR